MFNIATNLVWIHFWFSSSSSPGLSITLQQPKNIREIKIYSFSPFDLQKQAILLIIFHFTHSPLISPTLIKVYQRSLVHPYNDFEMISQLAKCQKSKAKLVSYPPPLARFSWHYRQTLRILLCLQQGVLLRLLQNVVHHLGFSCHSLRRNTPMLTAAPSGRDF